MLECLVGLEGAGEHVPKPPRQRAAQLDQDAGPPWEVHVEPRPLERRDDRRGDVLGCEATQAASVRHARGELRPHEVRHHHGHLDARSPQLGSGGLGETHHAVLGRGVGPEHGEAAAARERGHVDDVARPPRGHPAHRLLGAVDDRAQVEVDLPGDAVGALFHERPDDHDPRVVDEHVERPEPALDLVEEVGEAGVVGDVEPEPDRVAAEVGGRRLRGGAIEVAHGDPRALAGQGLGDRAADAPATAGDGDDLAVQRA